MGIVDVICSNHGGIDIQFSMKIFDDVDIRISLIMACHMRCPDF